MIKVHFYGHFTTGLVIFVSKLLGFYLFIFKNQNSEKGKNGSCWSKTESLTIDIAGIRNEVFNNLKWV
jgi:hypothetical protein